MSKYKLDNRTLTLLKAQVNLTAAGAVARVADQADGAAQAVAGEGRRPQQAERAGGDLQLVLHHAGLDHGGARLGVDRVDPGEVP